MTLRSPGSLDFGVDDKSLSGLWSGVLLAWELLFQPLLHMNDLGQVVIRCALVFCLCEMGYYCFSLVL